MPPHAVTFSRPRAGTKASAITATVVLAGSIILRVILWLTHYPLHRDEALYGYWARLIASGRDPLLLTPWVDKPPLVLYLSAASIRAFGASELALRLPGMIAGLLLVFVTFGFARRAYGARVALGAAGLLALSPFAILFAPTAFTDPWLALWLVAAAWAALARRPFLAGLLLGLAVASKQQGVLGAPLVLALLAYSLWLMADSRSQTTGPSRSEPSAMRHLLYVILGFALIFAPLTYWDSLRWVNRPSFWDRSVTTYGPLALAPLAEWPQRAVEWARQLGYLFGLPALSALMLLVAATVGVRAILALRTKRRDCSGPKAPPVMLGVKASFVLLTPRPPLLTTGTAAVVRRGGGRGADRRFPLSWRSACHRRERESGSEATWSPKNSEASRYGRREASAIRVDAVLAVYTVAYLVLHVITTVQTWDRYLLPILPWACVLAARGFGLGWARLGGRSRLQRPLRTIAPLLIAPALLYASWLGAAGRLPVGSDHGAYAGLDQVITLLRNQPADAVIYDRWLSWHYDFYLFGAPQERRWWGSGWKLADDAARTARAQPNRSQWVVLPAWETAAAEELHLPLASHGLALVEVRRIYRPDNTRAFTVYRIGRLRAGVTP